MALKPDRGDSRNTEIRFACGTQAAAGEILIYQTAASGVYGPGSGTLTVGGKPTVIKQTNPSGTKPAGMVLHDVISIDESQTHRNYHKYVHKIGEPCEFSKEGWFSTNSYVGSPTPGATAYLGASGLLCVTPSAAGGLVANPVVGEFEGVPDEDGYVSVRLTLPHKLS